MNPPQKITSNTNNEPTVYKLDQMEAHFSSPYIEELESRLELNSCSCYCICYSGNF